MAVKINRGEDYESINIILSEDRFPIAHNLKVEELMEQGAFETREQAKEWVNTTPIELELYYHKHSGLFGVESGAIESCGESLCSPYSGENLVDDYM